MFADATTSTDVVSTAGAVTSTDIVSTHDAATATDVVATSDAATATAIGSSLYGRPTESENDSPPPRGLSTCARPAVTPMTDNCDTTPKRIVTDAGPDNAASTVVAGA